MSGECLRKTKNTAVTPRADRHPLKSLPMRCEKYNLLANSTLSYWRGVMAATYLTSSLSMSSPPAEGAVAAAAEEELGPGSGDTAATGEGV